MSTELCARPGCGAPKAWHTRTSTVAETDVWPVDSAHAFVNPRRGEGGCLGDKCYCPAYVAPEPERKPYVVELTDEQAGSWLTSHDGQTSKIAKTPLAEYLAAHPQPLAFPANTKCVVRGCDFYTATVLCTHCAASLGKFTKQQLMDGPQPKRCICGGTPDDHDPVTGRCSHVARLRGKDGDDTFIEWRGCQCQKFEAAQ